MLVSIVFALLAGVSAQQDTEPTPKGAIYGIALGQDGQPAKHIRLIAHPLDAALAARLPSTETNDAGEYRFENVPWWGRYTVYADDENAGYSSFSTGYASVTSHPEVELSPEQPKAELNIFLPPKAGFIQIHLSSQKTGARIPGMLVTLMSIDQPSLPLLTMSCFSDHVILVPPNKSLLLHIASDGFREWSESVGRGRLVNLSSGAHLNIDVQLEPAE
jgi:hypothetical protein